MRYFESCVDENYSISFFLFTIEKFYRSILIFLLTPLAIAFYTIPVSTAFYGICISIQFMLFFYFYYASKVSIALMFSYTVLSMTPVLSNIFLNLWFFSYLYCLLLCLHHCYPFLIPTFLCTLCSLLSSVPSPSLLPSSVSLLLLPSVLCTRVLPCFSPLSPAQVAQLPLSVGDGHWHHICITWTTRDGYWEAYQDGEKLGSGENLAPWHPIKPGGAIVLGQEQVSPSHAKLPPPPPSQIPRRHDTDRGFQGIPCFREERFAHE